MIDRRSFLYASLGLLLWPAVRGARAQEPPAPSRDLRLALEESPYAYISPLLASGSESTCHGEVWYGWIDGAVVVTTSATSWKARSLASGLTRARIWVGDHGRWKQLVGRNESFRRAPRFDARAELAKDPELGDRLLAVFDEKYPREIGRWRDRMRAGHADGTRVVVRYVPDLA